MMVMNRFDLMLNNAAMPKQTWHGSFAGGEDAISMENVYLEPAKILPVYGQYDVIVAGGGCAGFACALAAGRNGARVLIVEQYAFFGGTATASLMINLVGFRNQVEPDGFQTTKGIGEELMLRLLKKGAARHSRNAYPSAIHSDLKGDLSYNYVIDAEQFKYETLMMLLEAGVEILFHTYVADTIVEDSAVKGIIIENKSGRQAILGSVVVDCTGDGDVAFRAGAPFWQAKPEDTPRLTDCLMYRIKGFSPDTTTYGCLDGDTMVVWGPSPGPLNTCDGKEFTKSEIIARSQVHQDLEEKIRKHPDLEGARVVETPVQLGVRQTRFIIGEYMLCDSDVLEGRKFEDSIAMGINPVICYYGYRRFLKHNGYQIPFRALIPKGIDNLLVAGRCISADQVAFESLRAMAHILAIGEGAGVGAAVCAAEKQTPRNANIQKIQQRLVRSGAEIGQGTA